MHVVRSAVHEGRMKLFGFFTGAAAKWATTEKTKPNKAKTKQKKTSVSGAQRDSSPLKEEINR